MSSDHRLQPSPPTTRPSRGVHALTELSPPTSHKECLMCQHDPDCPSADSSDREAARLAAHHPEQGWSLLCNGVLLFDDTGELLPDGQVVAPHRGSSTAVAA